MREAETIPIDEGVGHDVERLRPAPVEQTRLSESIGESRGSVLGGLGLKTWAIFVISLAVLVPTAGDFGVTWDEPQYRHSQLLSVHWWRQLSEVRSWHDLAQVLDPITLLYHWDYAHHGMNFHPPLAGQLNLAAHALFGHWMKDIPARRMASVIEFAVVVTIGFHFLSRRYGEWVGLGMAGSLLFMPRLYGQAHLMDTDIPGLLLWAATALAFWKGLHEPGARRWRVAVGILLGLAFVEKMGAVMVLLPLLLWLVIGHLPRTLVRPGGRFDWIDGTLTTGAMLAPLGLAFQQIQILQQQLPPPNITNLVIHRPVSAWSGAILAVPLAVWFVRRVLGRFFPNNKVWGVERPALETWTAILAFAPVIGWLGNPGWWREALPRLAHYYTLSVGRRGALPDIQIIYFGQIYEFSLPWHNAWVLIAITVPVAILGVGIIGLLWSIGQISRDRLPLYFVVNFLTLPVIRMLPTPAHDGVRLFLPTFFFLAAFAGWGTVWVADVLARGVYVPARFTRAALVAAVLGSSALALVRIHPYELSYYNELTGGPRGAWESGFELSYWYDAFNDQTIDDLNRRLPPNAKIDFLSELTKTAAGTFYLRKDLGSLRSDIILGRPDLPFPFVWLLAQDSKTTAFTRLLFAMRPWYASEPRQLDGARVVSVDDPVAVSRAWALFIMLDAADRSPKDPPAAPGWVYDYAPWLARLWGDGLTKAHRLAVNQTVLAWSRTDPDGLLAAARAIASRQPIIEGTPADRLMQLMTAEAKPPSLQVRHGLAEQLLDARPEALVEAVQILNAHRDEIVTVMTRYGYTDPKVIGGYLDRDLPSYASLETGK
jgi:hypothetical protein